MESACYGILPDVFTDADDLIQLVNDIFFFHISQNAVCRVYHGDRRIFFTLAAMMPAAPSWHE